MHYEDLLELHRNLKLESTQYEANRRNGAKSTGPKTAQGKATASKNSFRHGLTSRTPIAIEPEEVEAYLEFRAGMIESLEPANQFQTALVDRIAENAWRLRRVLDVETAMIHYNVTEGRSQHLGFTYRGDIDRFMTLSRYERNIEKSFFQTLEAFYLAKRASKPHPE
jgi:hypothetical protein